MFVFDSVVSLLFYGLNSLFSNRNLPKTSVSKVSQKVITTFPPPTPALRVASFNGKECFPPPISSQTSAYTEMNVEEALQSP